MGIKDEVYNEIVATTISLTPVEDVMDARLYVKDRVAEYLELNNLKFSRYDSLDMSLIQRLEEVGWVSDIVEFTLKDRVVIPIRSATGSIITLVGWRKGASKYYTIPSSDFSKETHWFNLDNALKKAFSSDSLLPRSVVVVEGIFDALMVDALGIPCVATMGSDVNEFKGALLNVFDKVVCIPDNDVVGRNALHKKRWKVPKSASFIYFNEKSLNLGQGIVKKIKDIDDICNLLDDESVIGLLQQVSRLQGGTVHYFDL